MPLLAEVDVLGELTARGRVPAALAGRPRLLALREEALALARELRLVEAKACWRVVPLECAPDRGGMLCVDGEVLQAPWLLPASGELTGVACAVATLGPRLEQHVAALFAQRRAALAVALDGIANELLFALGRKLQDRILAAVRRQGLAMAGELHAGDPGLALQAQGTVLRLAGAGAIGVALTRSLMMTPAKSSSVVLGVGRALPPQQWSRCDACPSRPRCQLAREAA